MNRAQRRAAESAARSERRNMTREDYEKQLGNDATGKELVRLRRAWESFWTTAERNGPFAVREAMHGLAEGAVFVVLPVQPQWDGPLDSWELLRFVAENALFRFGMRDEFVAYLRSTGDVETAHDIETRAGKASIPVVISAHGEAFVTSVVWRSN